MVRADLAASGTALMRRTNPCPPQYGIVAIGHADSQPLCAELTEMCTQLNRRTISRLRIASVESRLQRRATEQSNE